MSKFWDTKFGNALESAGKWTLDTLSELKVPILSQVAGMATGLLGSSLQKGLVNNHMSGAEREAAEFNANEAQKARDFNEQMDSTKYQRQVVDMQKAGINPALAMNGGVTTQATSNATGHASTSPAPMMSVVDLATTASNLRNLEAQRNLTDAQARLANANADAVDIENKYKDRLELAIVRGQEAANNMTQAQIDKINKDIEKADEEIKLIIAQAKTEEEKQNALRAQALVDKANAQQIKALTPVLVALKEAETERAKQEAAEAFAKAAYQQGLLDSGIIQDMAREQGAKADEAEAIALRLSGDNAKRGLTDKMSNGESFYTTKFDKFLGVTLWQLGDIIGNALNVGVNFQGNTSDSRSTSNNTSTSTSHNTNNNTNTNFGPPGYNGHGHK